MVRVRLRSEGDCFVFVSEVYSQERRDSSMDLGTETVRSRLLSESFRGTESSK